ARLGESRLGAGLEGPGLPAAARAQLAGARLAPDLDHASAPARRADLGAAHLPAGAVGALRVGDPERVAVGAPARRGGVRARWVVDRLRRPPPGAARAGAGLRSGRSGP